MKLQEIDELLGEVEDLRERLRESWDYLRHNLTGGRGDIVDLQLEASDTLGKLHDAYKQLDADTRI